MRRRLNLRRQYVVICLSHAYAQMPLVRLTREVLELEPDARAKALAKIRKLEQSLLNPLESLNWKIRGEQVKFHPALSLVQGLSERGAGEERRKGDARS